MYIWAAFIQNFIQKTEHNVVTLRGPKNLLERKVIERKVSFRINEQKDGEISKPTLRRD